MHTIESFPPIIDGSSRVLILGSMPGVESLKMNRYYAHDRNHFWRIIYTLFGMEPDTDYSRRIEFLLSKKIALWDVIHSCRREGSLDSNITEDVPNDIESLLRKHPRIEYILFNGTKAFTTFRRHFKSAGIGDLTLKKLPSTSPAHAVRFDKKLSEWSILLEYLGLD